MSADPDIKGTSFLVQRSSNLQLDPGVYTAGSCLAALCWHPANNCGTCLCFGVDSVLDKALFMEPMCIRHDWNYFSTLRFESCISFLHDYSSCVDRHAPFQQPPDSDAEHTSPPGSCPVPTTLTLGYWDDSSRAAGGWVHVSTFPI